MIKVQKWGKEWAVTKNDKPLRIMWIWQDVFFTGLQVARATGDRLQVLNEDGKVILDENFSRVHPILRAA